MWIYVAFAATLLLLVLFIYSLAGGKHKNDENEYEYAVKRLFRNNTDVTVRAVNKELSTPDKSHKSPNL